MTGTAWTVFQGTTPEPMQVEILGVLRAARGPGQDLILARLQGAKPEYTGVVDGMSGSPVYIDGKLVGALSYRIGTFTKEPIAGITPIGQMLEVRDLASSTLDAPSFSADARSEDAERVGDNATPLAGGKMIFQPMETPLVLSGFRPEAIRFWQQQTAGTALETVAAGGAISGPGSGSGAGLGSSSAPGTSPEAPVPPSLQPGSSVSMLLVRGDVEVAATCTITYIDPRQLLACGHPVLGAGPVSLPMTTSDVVTTVASPSRRLQDHQHRRHHRRLHPGPRIGPSRRFWRRGAYDPHARLRRCPDRPAQGQRGDSRSGCHDADRHAGGSAGFPQPNPTRAAKLSAIT